MFKVMKYSLVIIIAFIVFLPFIRSFLVIDEDPKKVDVIIVLSGDVGRLEKAAKLYHAGYANRLMLSLATEGGTTPEEAVALGVPEENLILEKEATSTYTNALYTQKKMKENHLQSAIVVSSDYHMRRVQLVFDRVYRNTNIEMIYVASLRDDAIWYCDKRNLFLTISEFIKLPGYWLGIYKVINL